MYSSLFFVHIDIRYIIEEDWHKSFLEKHISDIFLFF